MAEAEEVLRAIRNGEVDAVVVPGERGEQVYTLSGADRVYRQFIETMSEGAVTLSADGVILYCNVRSAELLGRPLDQVLGTALRNHLPPADQPALDAILAQARTAPSRGEINLKSSEGRLVPVYLSASRLQSEGAEMVFCLVLTDLTEQKSHEQIVAAERLARSILEQAAEAIIVCDEQGRVIRASQAAQRFCPENPLRRLFTEAFPLRSDGPSPFSLAPVLQGETLNHVEVELERQGQSFVLLLNAGPLLGIQSQRLGCVVTLTDISERQRAEKALKAERQRLHDVLEAIPIMVCLLTPDYHVAFANRAFREKFGESHGRRCYEYCFGEKEPCDFCQTYRVLETGKPHHWQVTTPDGASVIDVYDFPFADTDGSPMILEMDIDITERKRAEEALRESERRFREMLENVELIAVVLDAEGRVTFCNDYLLRLTGRSRADVLGQNWFAMFVPPEVHLEDVFRAGLEQGTIVPHFENEILTASGGRRWVSWNNTVLRDPQGRVIGTSSIGEDNTERKRAEEALRQHAEGLRARNEELARFNRASVGRELRMVELKQEVNELRRQAGQPPRYRVDFGGAGDGKASPNETPADGDPLARGRGHEASGFQDALPGA